MKTAAIYTFYQTGVHGKKEGFYTSIAQYSGQYLENTDFTVQYWVISYILV